nr:hypothetical protein [uncultured Oscillibacter sp.]
MNPHFLFGCAEKKTAVHGQKKRRFGAKPAPKGAFFASIRESCESVRQKLGRLLPGALCL